MRVKVLSQRWLFCSLLILPGCGCALTPLSPTIKPCLPTAARYPRGECEQNCTNIRQYGWRDFFNDPTLQQLICSALANNRDLRKAIQSMEQTGAMLGLKEPPLSRQNCCSAAVWEVEFWYRLKGLKGAELESYLATVEAQHATFISLIGHVANAYLTETELSESITLTTETLKIFQEFHRVMQLRFEEGAESKFDFLQVESLLQEMTAKLAELQLKRELNWNTLTLLVGSPICPNNHSLSQVVPCLTKEICPGFPSELPCNRPDVREAEHKLLAASLVEKCLALSEYERTIQVAFREVADALAKRAWFAKQVVIQGEMLAAQTERNRLAWIRFQSSNTPLLEVLDAEKNKLSAELALLEMQRSLLTSRIDLYIALGGGYTQRCGP